MNQRTVFHDSVIPLPALPGVAPSGLKLNLASAEQAGEPMVLSFSLDLAADKEAALAQAVANGKVIPYDEQMRDYAAPAPECDKLKQWLLKQGYTIEHVAADNSTIFARASVAQIERSLGVAMVRVTKDGITYTAARNAPSLPADVAGHVHAIGGLQPFIRAHRHSRKMPAMNRTGAAQKVNVNGVAAPTTNIANAPPYLTHEILKAYNAHATGLTGKGQIIAILIDSAPAAADMDAFWRRNGITAAAARLRVINVSGAALPPPEGEETLDAQWSGGIAQEAQIWIYASGSLQFTALDRALDAILADTASQPGLRQLSISLGLGESYMTAAELRTQNRKYLRLAAAGVNVFVSSGDAGSNPGTSGHASNGPLQAEYPASDAYVIGVGGTTLKLGADGAVSDERGWPDSGGGKSSHFKAPAWQRAQGIRSTTHNRLVPDVSLAADPEGGALVILNGQDEQYGGTSWSAPVWAGFCAMINEARVTAGKAPLAFLPPLLYPLQKAGCFRDIVSGSNGAYEASNGFDMVTGLGVPDIDGLVRALH